MKWQTLAVIGLRLAPAGIARVPAPRKQRLLQVTPSGAEALRETRGRWVTRHRPAGRPAAEHVWSEGLAAVKRPPPSALSLGALCFVTRRQQTSALGPGVVERSSTVSEPRAQVCRRPSTRPALPGPRAPRLGCQKTSAPGLSHRTCRQTAMQ